MDTTRHNHTKPRKQRQRQRHLNIMRTKTTQEQNAVRSIKIEGVTKKKFLLHRRHHKRPQTDGCPSFVIDHCDPLWQLQLLTLYKFVITCHTFITNDISQTSCKWCDHHQLENCNRRCKTSQKIMTTFMERQKMKLASTFSISKKLFFFSKKQKSWTFQKTNLFYFWPRDRFLVVSGIFRLRLYNEKKLGSICDQEADL